MNTTDTPKTALRAAQGPLMTEIQSAPIGVFDSGIGGLSVWRHLRATLPYEDFIYVADTANVPYGDKSEAWIRERVDQIVQWFLARGCKAVILACNTATAAAATTGACAISSITSRLASRRWQNSSAATRSRAAT